MDEFIEFMDTHFLFRNLWTPTFFLEKKAFCSGIFNLIFNKCHKSIIYLSLSWFQNNVCPGSQDSIMIEI